MKYRIENKYICDSKDLQLIRSRIKHLMKSDTHGDENCEYTVKSLYFDDYVNSGYYEKEDGVHYRKKYRLRYYDDDVSTLRLEIKKKVESYINKISCKVNKKDSSLMVKGKHLPLKEEMSEAYKDMYLNSRRYLLKPNIIIEYDREAYVLKEGNVRITLDKNISASSQHELYLDGSYHKVPLLESGQFILEVKYDEFLPSYIYRALSLNRLQQSSFSKYYIGRNKLKKTFFRK